MFRKPTKEALCVTLSQPMATASGVWGKSKPGLCSTLFSQMLFADLIDYNSKFEYKVTRKGKNILRKVMK